MMSSRRTALSLLILPVLLACGTEHPDEERGGRDGIASDEYDLTGAEVVLDAGDRFAMLTTDGAVKMGLTDERVYLRLSRALRDRIEGDVERDLDQEEGIGRWISGMVRGGVSRALSFRVSYDLNEIRDVRYEGGELVFDFVDPDESIDGFEVDGRPVTEAFGEDDARRFVEEFDRVRSAAAAPVRDPNP